MTTEFCRREDLLQGLMRKADVSDVAKVVAEAIQATAIDHSPQIEDLKKQIASRVSKHDLSQTLKAQTAILEELRREQQQLRRVIDERDEQLNMEKVSAEELKRTYSKQIQHLIREMEKLQVAVERKVNMDIFTERVESKADKQMVLNAVINKVSKIELDQILASKCERRDVEATLAQV